MNVKKAAEIIKKVAQNAPTMPANFTGAPTAPGGLADFDPNKNYGPGGNVEHNPVGTAPARVGGSDANVAKMQQAILHFANVAASTDITSLEGNKEGRQEGAQQIETPNPDFDSSKPEGPDNQKTIKNKEYLGGSNPFGNFLIQNYLGGADPVGRQYLNVDVVGSERGKASIDDTNLRGVIQSIKRIGTPGNETQTDGIWGQRTNNALKNIYALSYAMYHLAQDMRLNVSGLNDNTLDTFKGKIPANPNTLSPQQKDETAAELVSMINDMATVFDSFNKFILNNKQYKAFIDQKKSFVKYQQTENKTGNDILNDQEKQVVNSYKNPVPGIPATLADLNDMNSFLAFVAKLGRDPKNPEQVKETLNQISQTLAR